MHRSSSRLAALLLFCLYGWSCTSLSSFAFATLAEISGEHEVRVQWADSSIRVVLRHGAAKAPTVEVSDHHSPLTRALSSVCMLNGQGDHVFARSAELCTEIKGVASPRPTKAIEVAAHEMHSFAVHVQVQAGLSSAARCLIHGKTDRDERPCAGLGTIILLV